MKKIAVLAFSSLALMASAQSKIDNPGRILIEETRLALEQQQRDGVLSPKAAAELESKKYTVIVRIKGDEINFGDIDVEEVSRIGHSIFVEATTAQMQQLAELPDVESVSLGYDVKPLMNYARPAMEADVVQAGGDGLPKAFTGKGVVAGLFDSGLDVNHVNFLDADGEPRTQRLWVYNAAGRVTAYDTPAKIKAYSTDDKSETHGTHVLGIMAGSYKGPARYAVLDEKGTRTVVQQTDEGSSVPYYGVATDAELAVTCGVMTSNNFLLGAAQVANYAKSENKPCVVNLSLGNNIGPHDGTDATSKTLAEIGESAIVCISAGNEGEDNLFVTTTGKTLKTFAINSTQMPYVSYGIAEFYASDSELFDLTVIGYNRQTGKEEFSYKLDRNLGGKSMSLAGQTGFSTAYASGSSISISSNVSPSNNRYNVVITFDVQGKSTSIITGVIIEPKAGQTVDGFANVNNGLTFASLSVGGFVSGTPDNSINGLACGDNVLVIGSFVSAARYPTLSTTLTSRPAPTVGAISSFSSYGETFQGKKLPTVCAPGEMVISSYSYYYYNSGEITTNFLSALYTPDSSSLQSRTSPWAEMEGTSMASPAAAGVVALWLEADPSLTFNEVSDIIEVTSTKPTGLYDEDRWGAGKINALAGIKEVIQRSAGVGSVFADQDKRYIFQNLGGNQYNVFVEAEKAIDVYVYDMAGSRVMTAGGDSNDVTVDVSSLRPGIYVMAVEGQCCSRYAEKIVVK